MLHQLTTPHAPPVEHINLMENDPGLAVKLIQGELLGYVARENATVFQSSHVGHFSDCRSLEEVRSLRKTEPQTEAALARGAHPCLFSSRLLPNIMAFSHPTARNGQKPDIASGTHACLSQIVSLREGDGPYLSG